ncbi:MAG: DMT family transporter [Myxococcales bacterium]|nr:DMT family transporter [Myxococcales bacterium]
MVPFPYLGEACALLAPLCWSGAVILYRRTDLPASSMNLFKNLLAVGLLSLTMLALGVTIPMDRSSLDWGILALSAVLGLVVADILLLEGLHRIGASRVALVDTTYAPMMVVLAWVFLAERPGWGFALGALAVVAGVAVATIDLRQAIGAGDRFLGIGLLMAFGSICGNGISVILLKPILEASSLVEVTWCRLVIGIAGQVIWTTLRAEWPTALVAFRPSPSWRYLVPGSVMGTYLAMVLWLGGFKWADASVAAVLNQLATIYILVLAWLVLGERVERRQLAGGGLAVVGAVIVVLT